MDSERWETIQRLFHGASQLPPNEWVRFVHESAGGDGELESQILRMLEKDAQVSPFLDRKIEAIADEIFFESDPLANGTIGPYRLRRKLGEGGMGVVLLAWREDWRAHVAIKLPRDIWISSDRLKRFADEQRLLAQLVHSSIARIYESGVLANATPWFAMEYVDGQSITGYCKVHRCSVNERLRLFLQVCDAVQYAHSQAIIHRDLKPSNIFVLPGGQVKLLDFGIAKQVGDAREDVTFTRVGQHPVTLAYAAPEQLGENKISTQTDVYSLGVILYELLTGKLPFNVSSLTPSQAEAVIRTEHPEKPSSAAQKAIGQAASGDLSNDLSAGEWADLNVLILIAMHKDAAKRYSSVEALRRDIEHYVKGEPLEARPDSLPYRIGKFLKRRRLPVLAAAAMAVLIAGMISFYTLRLAKARDAALAEAARTRQARDFTQQLLEGGDREVGPSQDLRVVDLLDPGLTKAATLRSDPIQQGELYTTLGSIFFNLGEYAKADATLHAAYKVLSSSPQPHSHELAEVLVALGLLYSARGENQHAVDCVRKGLSMEQQTVPADKKLIFKYKASLGHVLEHQSSPEAIRLLSSLMQDQSSGADEAAKADVWNLLETAYLNMGRYAEAEPLNARVLAYEQRTLPANHPDLAGERINLGHIQFHKEQYAQAEQSYGKALSSYKIWYPKGHSETGDAMRFLAEAIFAENRFDDALAIARQAVAIEEQAEGPNHPRVAYALQIAGRAALAGGSLEEAKPDFLRETKILTLHKDRTNLPRAFCYLGDTYMRGKLYRQAEYCYRAGARLFLDSPSPDHESKKAEANQKLGEALFCQQRYRDAEESLLASDRFWSAQAKPSKQWSATRRDLARVYQAEKEPTKAAQLRIAADSVH